MLNKHQQAMISFPIADYKKYLSPEILKKGQVYFSGKHISSLEKEGNTWRATIQGSDIYSVIIYTRERAISGWDCTCPYNHGPVCKHVAAVFICLNESK